MAKTGPPWSAKAGAKLTGICSSAMGSQSPNCRKPFSYGTLQMPILKRRLGTSFAILLCPERMRCQREPMRPVIPKKRAQIFECGCRDRPGA
jgi:hypothetical protein